MGKSGRPRKPAPRRRDVSGSRSAAYRMKQQREMLENLPQRCTCWKGKRIWANRKDAAQRAAELRRLDGRQVEAYRCPETGNWHVGHPREGTEQ